MNVPSVPGFPRPRFSPHIFRTWRTGQFIQRPSGEALITRQKSQIRNSGFNFNLSQNKDAMSHHYSGPDFGFPHGDARLDFTDLYAFPKPGDASKSILIMNVHPSTGANPPGPTTDVALSPDAIYELRIDTNGDNVADIAYRVRVTSAKDGSQTATLRRVEGAQAAGIDDEGQIIVDAVPVSTEAEEHVADAGDYRFFVGWRSDPFFFDVNGALNNLQFTGDDYFAEADVCSIVLELPNSALGNKRVGIWARTIDGSSGKWVQADRGARPQQTPFLSGEQNAAYLGAEPADDGGWPRLLISLSSTTQWVPRPSRLCEEREPRTRAPGFVRKGKVVSTASLPALATNARTGHPPSVTVSGKSKAGPPANAANSPGYLSCLGARCAEFQRHHP